MSQATGPYVVLEAVGHPDAQSKVGCQGNGQDVHADEKERVASHAHEVVELNP